MLYRRQFFFGPRYVESLPEWKRIQVNDNYYLTIHPDLDHVNATKSDVSVISLGFILDPDNPKFSDNDIVNNLLNKTDAWVYRHRRDFYPQVHQLPA